MVRKGERLSQREKERESNSRVDRRRQYTDDRDLFVRVRAFQRKNFGGERERGRMKRKLNKMFRKGNNQAKNK